MTTLFQATLDLARLITDVFESTVTARAGVCQVETATVPDTTAVTVAGNAKVTVTSAAMSNSPKVIAVPVLQGDAEPEVGTACRLALAADADVIAAFAVTGASDVIILTAIKAAANDTSLNIAIADDTCLGVTAAPTSTNTTGGTAPTFDDSANLEADDYWNGGTIWWISGTNIGTTAIPTDFEGTTNHRFSITSSKLATVGDAYACIASEYPRRILRQKINQALRRIGAVPSDDTTLVTVSNQEEYTIPAGVGKIYQVEIATGLASPYNYELERDWIVDGSKLRFVGDSIPGTAGFKIRLIHQPVYTDLTTDAGVISDLINPNRIMWKAAVYALRWNLKRAGGTDKDLIRLLGDAEQKELEMDNLYPFPFVQREGRLGGSEEQPPSYF